MSMKRVFSAIVMDMDSGAILYAKKADEAHYPASITKLLPTLVALENGDLSDTLTFSEDSINILGLAAPVLTG